jgi:transcriptional regulator with XRE-family HTH domain
VLAYGCHMPSTPDTPTTPLGAELQAGRKRAQLSIRRAAELANISRTTWATLETGTRIEQGVPKASRTTPGFVIAAARVVNVDPAHALRLAGYDPEHWFPADVAAAAPADARTVADRIAMLSGERLNAVAAIVHLMLAPEHRGVDTAADDESGAA